MIDKLLQKLLLKTRIYSIQEKILGKYPEQNMIARYQNTILVNYIH